MRQIKFRAWTTRDKCWVGGFSIHNSGLYSDLINARLEKPQNICVADAHWQTLKEIDEQKDRIIIMQFTGLQDDTGKDIFENDIISVETDDKEKQVGYISYMEETTEYVVDYWKKGQKKSKGDSLSVLRNVKVIGNTFENPELLHDSKK